MVVLPNPQSPSCSTWHQPCPPPLLAYSRPLSPPQQQQQETWKMPLSISAEGCQLPLSGCLGSWLSSPTPVGGLLTLLRNKPLKVLITSGASVQAPFPWGQFRPGWVHTTPILLPSALSLPEAAGACLTRIWWRRPKKKFVLCIRDPAYTEELGKKWLRSPHGRGYSNCSAPCPPGKLQMCTHTHTHTQACVGRGVPRGLGGQGRRRRRRPSPQNYVSTEPRKVRYKPSGGGEHRGAKCAPAPRPGAAPWAQC